MAALFTGNSPPRLKVDRDLIPVQSVTSVKTEILTIMNDGGGILKGTAISDVSWIRIPNPRIETPFIVPFRIEIVPGRVSPNIPLKGAVTIITNGGTVKVRVECNTLPAIKPCLTVDERQFQFCNLRKGENFSFDLIIRNSGNGLLSGTIQSESDWIEVKSRTLWTQKVQVVQVTVHTTNAPIVRQPTGKIRIRSTGGDLEVPISINFRGGDGPILKLISSRIICLWDKKGIFEETLKIQNEGRGILRGTIPAPAPWIKILPSIFSAESSKKILFKIDTRMLTSDRSVSVPVQIITNAGTQILTLDVVPSRRTPVQVKKTRTSVRQQPRTKLTVYEPGGKVCTLISTGKAGGEGEIYYFADDDTKCAKIFHPHRRTQEIEEKIRTMIAAPPERELLQFLTWPLKPLTDLPGGGKIIGYVMRRIPDEYRSVHLWYDEPQEKEKRNLQSRIVASLQLARLVAGVHKAGHVIGDLRENNLLINKRGDLVLIDTDSFQIRDKNSRRTFWSRVGTGEYLPPEHLDGSFAESGCDRRYGDYFALAVLIFRFMMGGVHPFQAKGPLVKDAPATTDKILLGYFAFECRIAGISPPDYAPPYASLPSSFQTLFRETFVSGLREPHKRPGAERWETMLSSLIPREKKIQETTKQRVVEKQNQDTRITLDGWSDPNKLKTDQSGILFRTEAGIITTFVPGTQVFIVHNGINPPEPGAIYPHGIPQSLVIPLQVVYRDNMPVGWTIQAIDPGRFHPWHVAADPQSRRERFDGKFYFKHRIAACLNLTAVLISARNHGIRDVYLSERTVFVGPDASIRLLILPKPEQVMSTLKMSLSPAILIFRMLMDGYHPFHAIGSRTTGAGSHERRMASGLYPWSDDDPALRPPPQAPPIRTLPKPLIDLFDEEFQEFKGDSQDNNNIETWFNVIDQVYKRLVCCDLNPDHWYLPDSEGCPWCNLNYLKSVPTSICLVQQIFSPVVFLLMAPKVAGLLQERNRRRRTTSTRTEPPRWVTIPLPPERITRILLPKKNCILALGSGKKTRYLPVQYTRPWIACIHRSDDQEVDFKIQKDLKPRDKDSEMIHPIFIQGMEDITLVDEMIWVSMMDRLRGEGIGQPRRKIRTKTREKIQRRRPIEVMLYPIDLRIPEKAIDESDITNQVISNQVKPTSKRGARTRIRSRLQTILKDFIWGGDLDQSSPVSDENNSIHIPGSDEAHKTKNKKVTSEEKDHDLHSLDR
ncbi:hypothetical protein [Methanospirillum lacunae]|uniref:Protein kinase domain-containing protein n=1 Tax=Methanospirillum lacunae TaxID=668570 RepID=A0A2V2MXM0_9EURY|nr:hypothetical protein [Methanospirillum lacunae]PWR70136.1 hypothetical protein DK846_15455 [Methanospirillum lacunae]